MELPTRISELPESLPPPPLPEPRHKLFSTGGVILATVLGSCLAGGALLAINFRRLGRSGAAWSALGLSVAATAAVLTIAILVPDSVVPDKLVTVLLCGLQVVGAIIVSRKVLGKELDRHTALGGRFTSMWAAAGIGLAGAAVVVATICGAYAVILEQSTFAVNELEEVIYEGDATIDDARKVADILKKAQFFDRSSEKSVTITKDASGTTIAFVVSYGAWRDKEAVDGFKILGKELANTFGRPLKVNLDSELGITKKTIEIKE